MIEKWLRNEIDKKICNSNRIVILDQSSRWKFLVDAACTDICLYSTKDYSSKWQQKQDELFLRHEIEKNHKNDQVVIYVSRKLAADSFLIEYAKTGGCIELATEWVNHESSFKKYLGEYQLPIETKKQTIEEMGIPVKPCTPVMEIWMWQSQGIVMVIMNLS